MNNPFPERVRTIGIAAPASRADRNAYEASAELLRSFGIRLVEGRHLFEPEGKGDEMPYLSASDRKRAEDLNELIGNPEIDLILCLRGGYGSMRILDQIDWNTLRRRNLPLVGFSDITALHLAMSARRAGTPVAGQMAAALARSLQEESTFRAFRRALSVALEGKRAFTEHCPLTAIREGRAAGELIPVNLTLLTALCGTSDLPDLSGKILVLEEIGEPVRKVDRQLTQLHLAGILSKIAGLVFAQFTDCGEEELLLRLFRDSARFVSGPVLAGLPFGHEIPSLSFVYGERAEIRDGMLCF